MSGPGPNAKRAKRDPLLKAALDAALAAADRSAERVLFTGNHLESHVLTRQLERMKDDLSIKTTDEHDLIVTRLNEMAKEKAQKHAFDARLGHETMMADLFADETKKTNVFDCGVCLAEKPLPRMRLVTPCGHVFCAGCIATLNEANRTLDPGKEKNGCPKCRGPMASVLKPYF